MCIRDRYQRRVHGDQIKLILIYIYLRYQIKFLTENKMKTQTFFKLAFAVLLLIQIEQFNFDQRTQMRSINFERQTQLGISLKKVDEQISINDEPTEDPMPAVAKLGEGFIMAFVSDGDIYTEIFSSSYGVSTAAKIVHDEDDTDDVYMASYPSITLLSDGTYIVCYQVSGSKTASSVTTYYDAAICYQLSSAGDVVSNTRLVIQTTSPTSTDGATGQTPIYTSVYGLSTGGKFIILTNDQSSLISYICTVSSSVITISQKNILDSSTKTFGPDPAQMVEFTYESKQYAAIVYPQTVRAIGLILLPVNAFSTDSSPAIVYSTTDTTDYLLTPNVQYLVNGQLFITFVYQDGATNHYIYSRICSPRFYSSGNSFLCSNVATLISTTDYLICQHQSSIVLQSDEVLVTASCKAASTTQVLIAVLLDSDGVDSLDSWQIYSTQLAGTKYDRPSSVLLTKDRVLIAWEETDGNDVFGAVYTKISTYKNLGDTTTSSAQNLIVCLASLVFAMLILIML
eukprot:TRINITY_DN6239_c0_g1_i3.p1 TRINITY_DN6239_c0_g1~~TRINITY_DN6239_c0_g1_i3.p1  ORF type:complete len:524 (+),score=72.93 TRINITY_DN6239_c0_g1_i3:35-1573(+)